jgi:hypothetical protein
MNPWGSARPRRATDGRVLGPKHRIAVVSLQTCTGDRIWLTTEFGGALFTRYPIGPRPTDGRLSLRIRRRHRRRPGLRSVANVFKAGQGAGGVPANKVADGRGR